MNPSISDKLGLLQYEKPKSQKVKVNTLFFFFYSLCNIYGVLVHIKYTANVLEFKD